MDDLPFIHLCLLGCGLEVNLAPSGLGPHGRYFNSPVDQLLNAAKTLAAGGKIEDPTVKTSPEEPYFDRKACSGSLVFEYCYSKY